MGLEKLRMNRCQQTPFISGYTNPSEGHHATTSMPTPLGLRNGEKSSKGPAEFPASSCIVIMTGVVCFEPEGGKKKSSLGQSSKVSYCDVTGATAGNYARVSQQHDIRLRGHLKTKPGLTLHKSMQCPGRL